MRKELGGILLFFLVVLTLGSLLTYSPGDPAINHAGGAGPVNNFFGPLGAYTAGLLLMGFGLGAFWVPVLLLVAGIRLLGENRDKNACAASMRRTHGSACTRDRLAGSISIRRTTC